MHIHIDSPVAKSPTAQQPNSPTATDSLLLARRQLRPTGRQSQASTRASSLSHQDPACGLDSTPYIPHRLTGPQLRRTSRLALAPVRPSTHKSSTKTLPAGLSLLHTTSTHQSPRAQQPLTRFYSHVVSHKPLLRRRRHQTKMST